MTRQDYIDYIRHNLTSCEMLCQIAEEASELAQAALKLKRANEGTNPTPVTSTRCFINLCEEAGDVLNALQVYSNPLICPSEEDDEKLKRWAERLGMEEQSND